MNLAALKSPSFRAYLFTVHVALQGFWAQRVITGWLAWDLTGSAAFVGMVAFLNFAPTLLSGPFFGVIADRIDVRRASIFIYFLVFLISLGFSAVATTSMLLPWVVAGFSLATGLISAANHPVRMSLTPRLAPANAMSSVIALTAVNFNVSRLVGPAIGGALIQSAGAPLALLFTALAYMPVIITLNFVAAREREYPAGSMPAGYFAALAAGARYAWTRRLVRLGIVFSGLVAIAGRSVLETLPVLADGVYQAGPAGLGFMTAAAGAGALMASLVKVLGPEQKAGQVTTIVLVMAVLTPIFVGMLGFVDAFPMALLATGAIGFSVTAVAVSLQSMIQMELDDAYRGRVMGFWTMISIGGGAVGAMMMGVLSDLIGVHGAQFVVGGVMFVLCASVAYSLRSFRS